MKKEDFEAVIGLEVHAQLKTQSKLFCSCPTLFGKEANSQTCAICTGQPGSLPKLNQKALDYAIKAGLALDCSIQEKSVFSRKNYFYPDLPKGYQISQYDKPYAEGGKVRFVLDGRESSVTLTRIHMEEDAGKSIHNQAQGFSKVDFNRAGTPLIEIVSEPEIKSAEEAAQYLKSLRNTLLYLEINDGNLEEGSFRCDANVSVKLKSETKLGTRVELKNINSFRFIAKAINIEIERQIQIKLAGENVVQESRLFDPEQAKTFSMRTKEEAEDYRYFPDPDLPILNINQEKINELKNEIPELPMEKFSRYHKNLSAEDSYNLAGDRELSSFFEETISQGVTEKSASKWILGEYIRLKNQNTQNLKELSPKKLAEVIELVESEKISHSNGKKLLELICKEEKSAEELVIKHGLEQVKDSGLVESILQELIQNSPQQFEELKSGKQKLRGFFVGQTMKKTKGKANPKEVNEVLNRLIKG